MVTRIASSRKLDLENIQIVDFGCGTGLVGSKLSEIGCKNITGLDVSTAMLYEANKKKVYKHLEETVLGGD